MIDFDAEKHEYKIKGKVIPSVTQIIQAVQPERKFYGGGAAAYRGTQIHKALQFFDEGTLDECPDEYMGYLASYEFFKDSADWMPLEHNVRVYHKKPEYAGTADVVGLYNGKKAVIDFKSGVPYNSHLIQVAAYGMALKIDLRFVLYLKPNGQPSLVPASGKIVENVWMSHLDVFYWYRR